MFRLDDRVALVTGAARGIGRGIAETLGRQDAAVIVNDLDPDGAEQTAERLRANGARTAVACFDVTDFEACARGIAAGEKALGPVDILVNNAGGTPDGMWLTPHLETPRETWSKFLGMNLEGTLNCTRVVAEGTAHRGYGHIVSISSDAARVGVGSPIRGAAPS